MKQVKSVLQRPSLGQAEKEEALRMAAEYGQAAAFEAVLLSSAKPSQATLLHAAKWALRYQNRRLLGLVMQADVGRWLLSQEYLEEFLALERRSVRPDLVVLYLGERVLRAEMR